jgi:hypothetical protein
MVTSMGLMSIKAFTVEGAIGEKYRKQCRRFGVIHAL